MTGRFKDALTDVTDRLTVLAETYEPAELDRQEMGIYMRLRPNVPKGKEGWGRPGS